MFTSAVAETIPWRSPSSAPSSQPLVSSDEDREVDEGETFSGRQVQQISERLGARAIAREGGAEQEGQIDAGEAQLVGRPQACGQYQGADEASGKRTPDGH